MFIVHKLYNSLANKFPFVVKLRGWFQDISGLDWRANRYQYLDISIRKVKPEGIMEIGTWDGRNSERMIRKALKYQERVRYYGFDLFEDFYNIDSSSEFSGSKVPPPKNVVEKRLEKTGAQIHLFQGDTRKTLPEVVSNLPVMDFVFVDGGHSLDTIRSDWESVKQVMGEDTVVIFDDYWNRDDAGCKKIIEEIDISEFQVEVLPIQDTFQKSWGTLKINFVKVSRK